MYVTSFMRASTRPRWAALLDQHPRKTPHPHITLVSDSGDKFIPCYHGTAALYTHSGTLIPSPRRTRECANYSSARYPISLRSTPLSPPPQHAELTGHARPRPWVWCSVMPGGGKVGRQAQACLRGGAGSTPGHLLWKVGRGGSMRPPSPPNPHTPPSLCSPYPRALVSFTSVPHRPAQTWCTHDV